MADIVVHPTLKFIKAGYFGVLLFVVLLFLLWWFMGWQPLWVPALFLVLFIWPLEKHIHRLLEKITITDDTLRHQKGFVRRTTRTIHLANIQDVTVNQSFFGRLLGVGSIKVETAGKASDVIEAHIDHPQALADVILQRSQRVPGAQGSSV